MKRTFQWRGLLAAGVAMIALNGSAAPMRQSRHFTVVDGRPSSMISPGVLRTDRGEALTRLDADALLLSVERIKDILFRVLGISGEGAGRIRLFLYPATRPDNLMAQMTSYSTSGWEYRMEIPDQIEDQNLVRGVVNVLLLELANRGQGPKSSELPLWLVEGLSRHLFSIAGPDLVVESVPIGSMLRIVRERRGLDYMAEARQVLRGNPLLSFSDLAYPRREHWAPGRLRVYQCSAQLFVYELLHSKDGPTHVARMLRELPNCWNWETAFLRAFASDFARMLDVEKMWTVNVLAFTARDPSQVWSYVSCWDRLGQLLTVAAQVRQTADALPERKNLTLQEMIRNWESAAQGPVLRQKLGQLAGLRFNSPTNLTALIDDYERVIAGYLQKRAVAGKDPGNRMKPTLNASLVAQEAIRELDAIDRRRKAADPARALAVRNSTSP